MNLFSTRLIGGFLLVLAIVFGYMAWHHHVYVQGEANGIAITDAKWQVQIDKQKAEAAKLLANETAKVAKAETDLKDFRQTQGETDATNERAISMLADRLHAGGMLHDPWAKPGCGAGSGNPTEAAAVAPSAGGEHPAETSGVLSEHLSQVLLDLASGADQINAAYTSCRAQLYEDRRVINGSNK